MSKKGNLLFAKYAYSPNRLGYCGPSKQGAIFDYCVANQSDEGLLKLLTNFEGAYPYLLLIANENNIKDPFDERVVEAYWVGNELLINIKVANFYNSMKKRFQKRIDSSVMKWLLSKPPLGAKPHHSFHVLDVYTKTGSSRGNMKLNILKTINNCIIMWGKVKETKNLPFGKAGEKRKTKRYFVEFCPIILMDGKLDFGKRITREVLSPFIQPEVGDFVSFHWENICDILSQHQLHNLQYWTKYHLEIANSSI